MISQRATESAELNGASSDAEVSSWSGGVSPELNGSAGPGRHSSPDPGSSSEPREEQPPKVQSTVPSPPPPATESSLWPARLSTLAASFYAWLSRPRVRLTVTGVILLLIGGVFMTSSVWTLPVLVVGALMVLIAWIGRRLDGRFAVEWGEAGTQLEFRAKIQAAQPLRPALSRTTSSAHDVLRGSKAEPEQTEIIEGEAHTVEIEVAELKALIAAVETTSDELSQADASAQATRNLRVAYGGARSSEAAR